MFSSILLEPLKEEVKESIRCFPDFPKPGILFRDIMPIFQKPDLVNKLCHAIANHYRGKIDVVAGLEARGFLFGPLVAINLNVPFVAIRKKGKLPGPILRAKYIKEYGEDVVEMQADALEANLLNARVLIVDDLLATGGTLLAAIELLKQCHQVSSMQAFVLVELSELKGTKVLPKNVPVYSLLKYDD